MVVELFGTGEVARILGLRRSRLISMIADGRLPEPTVRIPGRRLFCREDVKELRKTMTELQAAVPNTKDSVEVEK